MCQNFKNGLDFFHTVIYNYVILNKEVEKIVSKNRTTHRYPKTSQLAVRIDKFVAT